MGIIRFSLFESKRVFWQFEVEGAFDRDKTFRKVINETVNQFIEKSQNIQGVIRKVSQAYAGALYTCAIDILTTFLLVLI